MLGDPKANTLLAIKRVKLGKAANATLEFTAPAQAGLAKLMLYFMCDSYMGADQEYEVTAAAITLNAAAFPVTPMHCARSPRVDMHVTGSALPHLFAAITSIVFFKH